MNRRFYRKVKRVLRLLSVIRQEDAVLTQAIRAGRVEEPGTSARLADMGTLLDLSELQLEELQDMDEQEDAA